MTFIQYDLGWTFSVSANDDTFTLTKGSMIDIIQKTAERTLITKEELAERLGISTSSVVRLCGQGLPSINVGVGERNRKLRFRMSDVEDWFIMREKLRSR
jgi:predicted DNA-binding transcriptional regulator AlpA